MCKYVCLRLSRDFDWISRSEVERNAQYVQLRRSSGWPPNHWHFYKSLNSPTTLRSKVVASGSGTGSTGTRRRLNPCKCKGRLMFLSTIFIDYILESYLIIPLCDLRHFELSFAVQAWIDWRAMRGFHCSIGFSKHSQSVLARSECRCSPKTTDAISRIGQHVTTLNRHMVHAAPCNSVNCEGDPEPLVNVRQIPSHRWNAVVAASVAQCLLDGRKLKDRQTDRTSAWMDASIEEGINKQTNTWNKAFRRVRYLLTQAVGPQQLWTLLAFNRILFGLEGIKFFRSFNEG